MKNKKYIFALALVLLAGVFALQKTGVVQAADLSSDELEDLITALTARVDTLEDELDTAKATIVDLKAQIVDLSDADATTDDADEDDDTTVTTPTKGNGIAVCHNGKTQHVNVHSALNLKSQGATIGVCAQERVKAQTKAKVGVETEDETEDDEEDETDDDTTTTTE